MSSDLRPVQLADVIVGGEHSGSAVRRLLDGWAVGPTSTLIDLPLDEARAILARLDDDAEQGELIDISRTTQRDLAGVGV
ncbi:MAG: hypothetical protein Q8K58_03910 [Acidimicrobiales bacterium]|nr:hypothetical protein [Acidimicrobiales bacterium]